MRRVGVVAWIALVACDRGTHKPAPPPVTAHDAGAALADARVDATIEIDAAIAVDAGVVVVPKNQASQCAAAAVRIAKSLRYFSKEELAEDRAAITKVCVAGPWSAKTLQCALHQADAYACLDDLPADQRHAFSTATNAVFCAHSDCIPDGFGPTIQLDQ